LKDYHALGVRNTTNKAYMLCGAFAKNIIEQEVSLQQALKSFSTAGSEESEVRAQCQSRRDQYR
jgi:hypothetical protein